MIPLSNKSCQQKDFSCFLLEIAVIIRIGGEK